MRMTNRWIQTLSLRTKLIAIIFTVSALASMTGFVIVLDNALHGLRQQMIANATLIAHTVADYSAVDLAFADPQSAARSLAVLESSSEVNNLVLLNNDRHVFVSLHPVLSGTVFQATPLDVWPHGESLRLIVPATYRGVRYGYVYLDYSTRKYWRDAQSQLQEFAVSLLVTLVTAFLLASWLQTSISWPVIRLAREAQQITQAADYTRRIVPSSNDEIGELYRSFNDMMSRIDQHVQERQVALDELRRQQAALQESQENLERRVAERTQALEVANREMEAFSYSVSHDLRAPLRAIDGFSQALLEDYAPSLDSTANDYLQRVRNAAQHMGRLIDDLLRLSRVSRSSLTPVTIDLSAMASEVLLDLQQSQPERCVDVAVQAGMSATGDAGLLRIVLDNLLGNAWKYTGRTEPARICVHSSVLDGETVYTIADNGAGFDMQHAGKLFGAFQRMHHASEFEGTGIGLATVQRIILRHKGRIWADAEPSKGARFNFTLGEARLFHNDGDSVGEK